MVSKKMKRNEQHNPLSPPRKERKRKERNKESSVWNPASKATRQGLSILMT